MNRSVTIAGWIVIVAAIAIASTAAIIAQGRFPSLAAVLRDASRHVVVRVLLLAGWAWLGWHFFVHTSR